MFCSLTLHFSCSQTGAEVKLSRLLKTESGIQHTHTITRYSNCIQHMSCGSHQVLHTNHMAAWQCDNIKSCTRREVNTRCSRSLSPVWEMSAVQMAEGFFISLGPVATCPRGMERDFSSINIAVGCWCRGRPGRLQQRWRATEGAFSYSLQGRSLFESEADVECNERWKINSSDFKLPFI